MRRAEGEATEPQPFPHDLNSWLQLLRKVGAEVLSDHATMTAAGLAFYSLLGIVPIMVSISALYGLMADPAAVLRFIHDLRGFLPSQAADVLADSLKASGVAFGLGFGLAISLLIVLWTAQWAASGLITALNIVFDTAEKRNFLLRQAAALAVALGGICFILAALLVVAILPVLRALFDVEFPYALFPVVRWPLLALLFMFGLSALYALAPSRARPRWQWLSWGAVVATLLWIAASGAFSAYASYAGTFNRYYGSLGGVAIFLFWLYLSGLIVLFGAEFEAELEARRLGRGEGAAKRVLKEREKNIGSGATADS